MSSTQQLLLTEGGGAIPNYIEDVFSTYLYTGNGSTQTITNNIDLSGKGGMVWLKLRNITTTYSNSVVDTVRGNSKALNTNLTNAESISPAGYDFSSFNSNGFTLGTDLNQLMNYSSGQFTSWTFRKQPKFFDVVTYTGNGSARTIAHSLGSAPGCIMVKRTDTTGDWWTYHRGLTSAGYYVRLNTTGAEATSATLWNSTAPTSTEFSLGVGSSNTSDGTYVAYIFAHDAGGFGLTGTDNVISCGSYTGTGAAGNAITLNYEPQFVIIKKTGPTSQNWGMFDNMRGVTTGGNDAFLAPNIANAETSANYIQFDATGFTCESGGTQVNESGSTYIYIAIRRGPMKVPTDATKVFAPVTYTGSGAAKTVTAGFPVDLSINGNRGTATIGQFFFDRLRGATNALNSTDTSAEATDSTSLTSFASNTAITLGTSASGWVNDSGRTYIDWMFQRAPSFFDEVCYTGTGSAKTVTHNLGVAPELIITKSRSVTNGWITGSSFGTTNFYLGVLNQTSAISEYPYAAGDFYVSKPTSTTYSVGTDSSVNGNGNTYVAYLFATCAGVSKVGSYTGNGSTQAIACGFAGGARFVLIKRTDSTGNWYVYDTARGMTTLTDPYLLLNSTAAESATLGSVTTTTGGFTVNAAILAAINTNAASYIFFAVA